VIAHRLTTIRKASIIFFVVKDGRIVERGKQEELLNLRGLYSELHNLQFGEESARPTDYSAQRSCAQQLY
jgi:ABC-type multidrug transport system fused ATPase/permease subunit